MSNTNMSPIGSTIQSISSDASSQSSNARGRRRNTRNQQTRRARQYSSRATLRTIISKAAKKTTNIGNIRDKSRLKKSKASPLERYIEYNIDKFVKNEVWKVPDGMVMCKGCGGWKKL